MIFKAYTVHVSRDCNYKPTPNCFATLKPAVKVHKPLLMCMLKLYEVEIREADFNLGRSVQSLCDSVNRGECSYIISIVLTSFILYLVGLFLHD